MNYKAVDIAKYIIDYFHENNLGRISCRKIQSILYFLQADFLVNENQPLFTDDLLTSSYGVVVDSVERKYKIYGNADIPSQSLYYSLPIVISGRVNKMLERLKDYTSSDLLQIIFNQKPFKDNQKKSCNYISHKDLYEFFKE